MLAPLRDFGRYSRRALTALAVLAAMLSSLPISSFSDQLVAKKKATLRQNVRLAEQLVGWTIDVDVDSGAAGAASESKKRPKSVSTGQGKQSVTHLLGRG